MTITKGENRLRTLEEWQVQAGPKRPDQWCPDRSAMELARAWLSVQSPALPPEVEGALTSHPAFGRVAESKAEPEVQLRFDSFRGEPRNTDLLVHARDDRGEFLIAVEGKADEPFGETVADALASAVERRFANPRSRGVERISALAAALLGPSRPGEAHLRDLRYQLLTAVAGAAKAAAFSEQRILFLVHEFRTIRTEDRRHAQNAADLNAFANRLSHGGADC